MPGATRRNKPLKGTSSIGDFTDFSISNVANGDLLVFDSGTEVWENVKALDGNYTNTGNITSLNLIATNNVTTEGLLVNLNATITGNLTQTGNITVSGTTALQGLTVATGAQFDTTLSVAGTLSGAGFSFSGNGTVTGTLGVTGTLSAGTFAPTTLNVSGDSTLTGFLSVDGVAQFNDTVTVNGALSATSLGADSINSGGSLSAGTILAWPSGNITDDLADMTLASTLTSGHLVVTGKQSDATIVTMLDLDPDAHHIIGGIDGVLVPVGTTGEEPSGVNGMIRYDSTTNKFRIFENSSWANMAGGGIADGTSTGNVLYWNGSAWVETPQLVLVPAGAFTVQHATTDVIQTETQGVGIADPSGGDDPALRWYDTIGGTQLAQSQVFASDHYRDNRTNTGKFFFRGSTSTPADTTVLTLDPAAGVDAYFAGTAKFRVATDGIEVASTNAAVRLMGTIGGTQIAGFQIFADDLYIDNWTNGGDVFFRSSTSSAADEVWMEHTQGAGIKTYFNGLLKTETVGNGLNVHASTGFSNGHLHVFDLSGQEGQLRKLETGSLDVYNQETSMFVRIMGTDSGAGEAVMATFDPDGASVLNFDETAALTTDAQGIVVTPVTTGTALIQISALTTKNSSINFLEAGSAKGQIQYDATANEFYIRATVAGEQIRLFGPGGSMITCVDAGAITLHDDVEMDGALNHDGSTVGFFGTTPASKPTSVAVTAAGIHAALVTLGLIAGP